ncbi:hypothetical protein ABIA32_002715 [Streptacidiphilus sp. MAP12-20]|uniref:hypothetical protein n=1 Tax=Streptacidiphilus sp. MAP12-20 TaxID=3156299 RepID=UPI0035192B8A
MTTSDTASRPGRGLLFHATAGAAALMLLPWWHRVLHVGGDEYGGAWALAGLAWWLHHRRPTWLRHALVCSAVAGAVTDLPVLHDSVSWLTGAVW